MAPSIDGHHWIWAVNCWVVLSGWDIRGEAPTYVANEHSLESVPSAFISPQSCLQAAFLERDVAASWVSGHSPPPVYVPGQRQATSCIPYQQGHRWAPSAWRSPGRCDITMGRFQAESSTQLQEALRNLGTLDSSLLCDTAACVKFNLVSSVVVNSSVVSRDCCNFKHRNKL